jgi:hypothetical protein
MLQLAKYREGRTYLALISTTINAVTGKARTIEGRAAERGNMTLWEGTAQQSVACPYKYSQRQFVAL